MSYAASENERSREGIARIGRVTSLDLGNARARLTFGGTTESDWLPFSALRSGAISVWAPPSLGEQVVVFSPSGDSAQAVILGSIPSEANPPPSGNPAELKAVIGGSSITMDGSKIALESNGSSITLDAGGVRINGARVDLN